MPDVIAEAFVAIQPEPGTEAKLGRSLQSRLSGTLGRVGRAAGLALAAGAAAAFAAGGLLGRSAIAAARDLNESVSKTQVIFGNASAAVEKFAAGAARSLGQSRKQALDAASNFALFGQSAGLTGQKLVDFSLDLTSLASDLASFGNSSPEEAIQAIGAALRGEAEPIRRYNVLLDDASLRQSALRLGLIKTTKDALTPQQRVLAAQAEIFRQTSKAQGDFARTADQAANKERILAATIENTKARIGAGLLPAYSALLGVLAPLAERVAPVLARGFEGVALAVNLVARAFRDPDITSSGLNGVFERIGVTLRAVYDFVTGTLVPGFVRNVAPAFRTVRDAASDLVNAILPPLVDAVQIAGRFLGENLIPVLGGVAAAFIAVNVAQFVSQLQTLTTAAGGLGRALVGTLGGPVGAVAVGIAALVAGLVIAYRESEGFRRVVDRVGDALAAAGRAVLGVLGPALEFFSRQVLPALRDAFDGIVRAIMENREGLTALARAIGTVAGVVAGVLLTVLGALVRVLGPVLAVAIRVLGVALTGIITVLGAVGTAIGPVARFLTDLARVVADVLGTALRGAQTLFNGLMAVLRPVAAVVEFLARVAIYLTVLAFYPLLRVVGTVIDAFSRMRGEVGGKVAPVVDRLRDVLGKAADVIRNVVVPVIDRLRVIVRTGLLVAVEALEPVVRRVGDVFNTVFSGVKALFDGLVRGIVAGINVIIDAINAIPDIKIPKVGEFGIPDIGRIGVPGANVDSGGTGGGSTVRDPEARRSDAQATARAVRQELTGLAVVLNGKVVGAIDDAQGRRATVRSR